MLLCFERSEMRVIWPLFKERQTIFPRWWCFGGIMRAKSGFIENFVVIYSSKFFERAQGRAWAGGQRKNSFKTRLFSLNKFF
jgi:hypothetical protein